jgi:hypothetical protein
VGVIDGVYCVTILLFRYLGILGGGVSDFIINLPEIAEDGMGVAQVMPDGRVGLDFVVTSVELVGDAEGTTLSLSFVNAGTAVLRGVELALRGIRGGEETRTDFIPKYTNPTNTITPTTIIIILFFIIFFKLLI